MSETRDSSLMAAKAHKILVLRLNNPLCLFCIRSVIKWRVFFVAQAARMHPSPHVLQARTSLSHRNEAHAARRWLLLMKVCLLSHALRLTKEMQPIGRGVVPRAFCASRHRQCITKPTSGESQRSLGSLQTVTKPNHPSLVLPASKQGCNCPKPGAND